MSKIGWTKEQGQAIAVRDANVLVSAAAGAGKTAVLVERLISRITSERDPVSVDSILVVTFTNAAAQEMKERIAVALTARQQAEPANLYLSRQLLLLNKASICTLHSFCLDLIRQNYYCLELPQGLTLDPAFRVGDEIETTLLKLDVLEELFEEKYSLEDPLFQQLVECYGGTKDDQGLQNLILKLYDFSRSQPEPEKWLQEAAAAFRQGGEAPEIARYFAYLTATVTSRLEEALAALREAAGFAAAPGGPEVYWQTLQEEIAALQDLVGQGPKGWEHLYAALQEEPFGKLRPCRGEVDEFLKEKAQALRNEAKDIVKSIRKDYLNRTPVEMITDMQSLAPLLEYLCLLVAEYSRRYFQAKLNKDIIDFADIEHLALKLLSRETEQGPKPTALAEKLQQRFKEVLIDEYQDINGVQEAILTMVSRQNWEQPNMFMVGDVKQSIYGFRLANPRLFLAKYESYRQDPGAREIKIMLAENFRSRPLILDGVNFVFRQLMTERMGGLVYDREAELVCGAPYPPLPGEEKKGLAEFPVKLYLIDRSSQSEAVPEAVNPEKEEENEEAVSEEELDVLQVEARLAAKRIQELLGTPVWDKTLKEYRPASYRDMVVLLRTTKGAAEVFLEEFRQAGLPAYADIGGGYLAAQEIRLMVSLLQVIDNPRQDLPLVAVLRSNLAGFTSSELAAIRLRRPRGDFYDALRLAARKEEDELSGKIRRFLAKLQSWRTYARRHSLSDLLWLLYRETGYYTYVGALPGGEQRQANLRALQDRARQYEQTTMRGLFKFLRFLEKLEDKNGDLGAARALGENEDVVRIMSIHKSKGLEFPIVIAAGLGRKFNFLDLRDDVLVDKDLGLGPVWADAELRLKYPTLARMVVKDKLKRETLAEEVRILYVAMTRAREGLILIGTVRNLEKKLARWQRVLNHQKWALPPGLADGATCFLDWLGPALLRHKDAQVLKERCPAKPVQGQADSQGPWLDDPSRWCIEVENSSGTAFQEKMQENKYAAELEKISRLEAVEAGAELGELQNLIEERLNWVYPQSSVVGIPAKFSVSELKNHYRQHEQDPSSAEMIRHFRINSRRPRFLQEQQGLLAAEKGSALHLVMRYLDLQRVSTLQEIELQLEEMIAREYLSPLQREVIDPQVILHFFQEPIGQRLLASPLVRREIPFTLALNPGEIYSFLGEDCQESIILQGTLDCLFREGEDMVLIDYKSDYIAPDSVPAFMERYRVQLELYARAVETILKIKVKEKVLYSFYLGKAFTLT